MHDAGPAVGPASRSHGTRAARSRFAAWRIPLRTGGPGRQGGCRNLPFESDASLRARHRVRVGRRLDSRITTSRDGRGAASSDSASERVLPALSCTPSSAKDFQELGRLHGLPARDFPVLHQKRRYPQAFPMQMPKLSSSTRTLTRYLVSVAIRRGVYCVSQA